jgi:hypothetical protein
MQKKNIALNSKKGEGQKSVPSCLRGCNKKKDKENKSRNDKVLLAKIEEYLRQSEITNKRNYEYVMDKLKKKDLKTYHSIQALLRLPEYKKDMKELDDLIDEDRSGDNKLYYEKRNQIADKYNIDLPVEECDIMAYSLGEIKEMFKVAPNAVRVIKADNYKKKIDKDGKFSGIDYGPCLFDRKYLCVQIDMFMKKKVIMDELDEIVGFYEKHVNKPQNRDKDTVLDIWKVYDLSERGFNCSQIARQLSGMKGNPSDNQNLMAVYKQVKRAVNKAAIEMEKVKSTIKGDMKLQPK